MKDNANLQSKAEYPSKVCCQKTKEEIEMNLVPETTQFPEF